MATGEDIPMDNLGEGKDEHLIQEQDPEHDPIDYDKGIDESLLDRLKRLKKFSQQQPEEIQSFTNPAFETEVTVKEIELNKIKSNLEKKNPLIDLKFLDIDLVKNGVIKISGQLKSGKYTKYYKFRNSRGEFVKIENLPKSIKGPLGPSLEEILIALNDNKEKNNKK